MTLALEAGQSSMVLVQNEMTKPGEERCALGLALRDFAVRPEVAGGSRGVTVRRSA